METNANATKPFDVSAYFYDLFYSDKNYFAESHFVHNILKSYNHGARHLLELGCGSGNYSHHFSNLGYEITGLDLSAKMIERADCKTIPRFTGVVADISSFELNEKYDVASAMFHVISYLTETDSVISCFKNVEKHLKPGGIFFFDVWFTPAVCFLQPEAREKKVADQNYTITRKAVPIINVERNVVHVNYSFSVKETASDRIETSEETHTMRHFSTPEISLMAQLAGLKLIESKEMLTGNQPSNNTWSVYYVLQKKYENDTSK